MEIPTVESCGPFSLSIGGLMIGFLQLGIHVLAFLFTIRFGLAWVAPITLVGMAVSLAWIYGIQEKKVIYMIPAFIPFVVVTVSGIISVCVFPILASIHVLAGSGRHYGEDEVFGSFMATIVLTCIVTYLTIVGYSLCKSLQEAHRLENTRLPYTPSCPTQTMLRSNPLNSVNKSSM